MAELSSATEMELFAIQAAKSARNILEELGTSCSGTQENNDSEVDGGGEPYETIDELREVLLLGDSLSKVSWGANAMHNRAFYIVDTGHKVTVKPKDKKKKKDSTIKESIARVKEYLDQWMIDNDWNQRQTEVSNRLDRHGEVFDILYYDPGEDEGLKLSFAEPNDLEDDPDSPYLDNAESDGKFMDSLGVRRMNDILHKPISYYINDRGTDSGSWYDDLVANMKRDQLAEFPETNALIQHRKRNVLSVDPRGLTLYWPVRDELTWAKRLLSNLMRVSGFQAAFGLIRIVNEAHTVDAVKSYLGSQQTGVAGQSAPEKFDFPAAGVVTAPSSIKYEFPETGQGNSNHIEVLLNLLRACASGLRVPEFMLTANVSEGNFASTLVSEGPFHKGMRYEQGLMVKEDLRILHQALRFAASKRLGDLTDEDIDSIILEVKPPRVQTRNRKEDYEVNSDMWEKGLLSGKSLAASEDRDFEAEQAQIGIERETEHPAPLAITGPEPPGPEAGLKSDQMSEKGVLAGEPKDTPES